MPDAARKGDDRNGGGAPQHLMRAYAKLISPILLLVMWEVGIRFAWLDPRLVAPPSLVMIELWRLIESGDLVAALAASLFRVVTGFLIAATIGIALGALMARA